MAEDGKILGLGDSKAIDEPLLVQEIVSYNIVCKCGMGMQAVMAYTPGEGIESQTACPRCAGKIKVAVDDEGTIRAWHVGQGLHLAK